MEDGLRLAEIASRVALVIGGAIGLYLAYMRVAAANRQAEAQIRQAEAAAKQADLGRRKYAADIFQQAVSQLRDEKLEVRLFAIYSLRQLVEEYPEDKRAVLELLTAYVRDNSMTWGENEPPIDVREMMQIIKSNLRNTQ